MSTTRLVEGQVDFDYDAIDFDYDKLDEMDILAEMPEVLQEFINEKMRRENQEMLTRVISWIYDSNDYRLKIATIVCAFGLPIFMGKSIAEIAEIHKVTKQALSKSIKLFQEDFNLPPVRGQKSLESCGKYREAQLKRHKRIRDERL
jgi:hypothetical protein